MITEFQNFFHCCISWRMLYVTIQGQQIFLSLKGFDRNILNTKILWIIARIHYISVIRSAREPYKMNWLPACLRPLCYLSIGPSRSVILKHNFSFEKLSAVRQLKQNTFGGFRFSFRTSELMGRMFESIPWHNSLFASSQLLFSRIFSFVIG